MLTQDLPYWIDNEILIQLNALTKAAAAICQANTASLSIISFTGKKTISLHQNGEMETGDIDTLIDFCIKSNERVYTSNLTNDCSAREITACKKNAIPFYTGIPLKDSYEKINGVLSVLHINEINLTHGQVEQLASVAKQAAAFLTINQKLTELQRHYHDAVKLNTLFEETNTVANVGAWEVDVLNNTIFWSACTKAIHGVSPEYIPELQSAINFYKEGDSRNRITACVDAAINEGKAFDEELQIVKHTGEVCWVRTKGNVEMAGGTCVRIFGTFQDVQQQKIQQDILENSELKYRSIIENSLTATMLTRPDGSVLDANPAAEEIFGYTREELLQQVREKLIDISEPNYNILREKRKIHGRISGELRGIRKNGERFPLLYSSALFRDKDGGLMASMSAIDISNIKTAENELRMSKEELHAAFEFASIGVALVSLDGRWLKVNKYLCDILEYTEAEMLSMSFQQMVHPMDLLLDVEQQAGLLNGAIDSYKIEKRHLTKSGDTVWLNVSVSRINDKQGSVSHFICHLENINDRKFAEAEVLQEKETLANVIEGTNAAIWEWNIQTGETVYNERWAEILGYTLSELSPIDKYTWNRLVHAEDRKKSNELVNACFKRETELYECEYRMLHKKGHWVWVLDRGKVISWNSHGEPLKMFGTHIDITSRKNAETALAFREKRFKGIFNSAFSFIGFLAPDGSLLEANDTILKFSGVKAEMVIGKKLWDCYWGKSTPEDLEKLKGKIYRAAQGESLQYELEIHNRDGVPMVILFNLKPLFDEDGKVSAIISEGRPIQDIVDARRALLQKNTELEEFAFMASHDLREPLRMVHSFMELLRDNYQDQLDAKAKKYIGFAIDGSIRMSVMVSELLTYARMGSDGSQKEVIDTSQMLKGIVALQSAVLEEKGAIVTLGLLPEIKGIKTAMMVLFQNLLSNAIKYQLPDRQPVIKISGEESENNFLFAVSDNGIGIAEKSKEDVFKLFNRLHNGTEYTGSGMGLATCKKIVEQHGGTIWLQSTEGEGSTFYFTIAKENG